MTTPDRPRFEYTAEERAAMLRGMHGVSDAFYAGAVRVGCHAFIEFCGLLNEFIKLCEEAHAQDIDFTMANVHTGQHLPFKDYHIAYLNEKLECIYGLRFQVDRPGDYRGWPRGELLCPGCYVSADGERTCQRDQTHAGHVSEPTTQGDTTCPSPTISTTGPTP